MQEHKKDKIFVGKESKEKLHKAYIQLKKYVDTALLTNFEIDEATIAEEEFSKGLRDLDESKDQDLSQMEAK